MFWNSVSQKVLCIFNQSFITDSRALTVIKLIVSHFWCFGTNDTFFVIFKLCDEFELCDKIKQDQGFQEKDLFERIFFQDAQFSIQSWNNWIPH